MPGLIPQQHHHRSTTKSTQRPYKPRFASKNELRDRSKGRIERPEKGVRKTPHQQVMSKLDRRNQAKQRRIAKDHAHEKATNVFAGKDGAPRIVAIVPLCTDLDNDAAIRNLKSSVDVDTAPQADGLASVLVDRFKQKLQFLTCGRSLISALDVCRIADYVVFVLSAEQEVGSEGEQLLRCIEGQGVSNVYTVVQGLDSVTQPKKKQQTLSSLKSFMLHFFPNQERIVSLDSRQECQNLVRSLCTTTPRGIRWREDRSWMLVEGVQWLDHSPKALNDSSASADVIFTGIVRGQPLKADRLIHVGDWGDFQISQITAAPDVLPKKGKDNAMSVESQGGEQHLDQPTGERDTLDELAPEEVIMNDADEEAPSLIPSQRKGVLVDDQHYYSGDENENVADLPKKLPKGTSKYQSAWYLGDMSDSGSDLEDGADMDEDLDMDAPAGPADGAAASIAPDLTEAAESEYPQSEMFLDPSPQEEAEAEELASYRAKKASAAEEDRQFPDEIELPPNVSARERLARYRGLRSLRTSPWDTEEDVPYRPADWSRLLDVNDYKAAKNKVMREALVGGVKPGTRVHVHLSNVPLAFHTDEKRGTPPALFSLLRHEHKRTAMNFTMSLSSDFQRPIKAKEELIMQCGPRRFIINPLFSQAGNTPNDVHKFERYLHPGRTAVASVTAPLTWGAVPALFFIRKSATEDKSDEQMETEGEQGLELIGHGTAIAPSTSRVIAKRVVLTGQAYKIHRKLVTVRYMFFNAEDIAWFKALQLWTNRGRQGTIKESLGTHGYFKAMFDANVGMQDAIGVSLYKRVWPRPARDFSEMAL